MRNRKLLLLLGSGLLLLWITGCSDEPRANDSRPLRFGYYASESAFLFAGSPVNMGVKNFSYPESATFEWRFGDGESSTDVVGKHSYKFPGTYRISLTVDFGKQFSWDTLINIIAPPKSFGAKTSGEHGIFLFQDKADHYRVFYTANPESGSDRFGVMVVTPEFDSTYAKQFPFALEPLGYWPVPMIVDDREQFVLLNYQFWMFDLAGNLQTKQPSPLRWESPRLAQATQGYEIVSSNYGSPQVIIDLLDAQGVAKDHVEYDVRIVDYDYVGVIREGTDKLLLRYQKPSRDGSMVRKQTLNGEVLFEKKYKYWSIFDILPQSSGYLYVAEMPDEYFGKTLRAVRVDSQGDILWDVPYAVMDVSYSSAEYGPPAIHAFEQDGFTYIFTPDMVGIKVDADGKVVWQRLLGWRGDICNAAILNNKNNFVLLGSHNPDPYHDRSDLILIEIDRDGNVINHP